MARREQTTTADPDVEASRAELAVLHGSKSAAQQEVLVIAEDKKRLTDELEETRTRVALELETIEKDKEAKIKALCDRYEAALASTEKIEGENVIVLERNKQLLSEKTKYEEDIQTLSAKQAPLLASVEQLTITERKISATIDQHAPVVEKLEQRMVLLTEEIEKSEGKIVELNKSKDAVIQEIANKSKELLPIETSRNEKQNELALLEKATEEQKQKLSSIKGELVLAQEKTAARERGWQKRETEISARAGDLSRLEERVNQKIEILKEAKKEFTTEHLLRMGIRD